jgi:hypothetical protein
MKFIFQFASFIVVASSLGAQTFRSSPQVQEVRVVENGDEVGIEIVLTSPVDAKMVSTPRSHRLIVQISGAIPAVQVQTPSPNEKGIKSIRVELHRANPPMTWVVVALDQMRPYSLANDGNEITLRLLPVRSGSRPARRRGPAPAAKSSVLGSLGRRRRDATLTEANAPQSSSDSPAALNSAVSLNSPDKPAPPAQQPAVGTAPLAAATIETPGRAPTSASPAPSTGALDAQVAGLQPRTEASSETSAAQNPISQLPQPNPDIHVVFKVKYVAQGVAYLEGGRSSGLSEGLKLFVEDTDPSTGRPIDFVDGQQKAVAALRVIAVAETSAATEINDSTRDVKPGDWAVLSSEDTAALVAQHSLSATRKYPAVVSFTAEDDALDDEARTEVPRPPLPEINRARGRIGFDYSGVSSSLGGNNSLGLVIRTDITRMYGTYWSVSGYWRGRLNSSSSGPATMQDLINRTYHMGLTYDSPQSPWVAGFGRLYLPWASSLDTIDGGYFGRRISNNAILGMFGGSTPDPTSWSYNPNRRLGGTFINFEGGSFDGARYTSTSGMGISTLKWTIDRPFAFFENGFSYKRYLSIYHSLQADSPRGNPAVPAPGAGISRSFLTVRVQASERIEFDFNHTYFRDLPTFDPQLIGTGLLDKYLFQGFSAGARVEVARRIWVYTNLGSSNRSGDAKSSLNQMYGVTFGSLPRIGVRADFRYSKFDSAFGGGSYKALSLSRSLHESFRWEMLAGSQSFASAFSKTTSARFLTGNFEQNVGTNYFLQGGYTISRGGLQNYNQWMFTFGYRFDNRHKSRGQ